MSSENETAWNTHRRLVLDTLRSVVSTAEKNEDKIADLDRRVIVIEERQRGVLRAIDRLDPPSSPAIRAESNDGWIVTVAKSPWTYLVIFGVVAIVAIVFILKGYPGILDTPREASK